MFSKSNMTKMLKQAQEMQTRMAEVQEGLNDLTIEESSQNLVKVSVNGKMDVLDIEISDDAMEQEKDVLEDLLITTLNKALRKAQDEAQDRMNAVSGNMLGEMKLPGM